MSRSVAALFHLTKISAPTHAIHSVSCFKIKLDSYLVNQMPKRIVYNTDWFPLSDGGQQRMTEQFIQTLEAVTGVLHTKMSFSEKWAQYAPDDASDKSLKDYLAKASIPYSQHRPS